MSKSENSWKEYYSDMTSGAHRFQDETYLKKLAKEKIFLLDGGKSLLDFGCGSADLLIYIIPEYERITGVDFSPSMLKVAQEKIDLQGFKNVTLYCEDDKTMWDKVDSLYDRIQSTEVIQYLTLNDVDNFISHASERLQPKGKIIFFDALDPRLFYLWKAGLFLKDLNYFLVFFHFVRLKLYHIFSGGPDDRKMGYAYDKNVVEKIAGKYGFQMECVNAMYYEYRYHIILTR